MEILKKCSLCRVQFSFNIGWSRAFCSLCNFQQFFKDERIIFILFPHHLYSISINVENEQLTIIKIYSNNGCIFEKAIENWQPDFSNIQQLKNKLENILLLS